MAKTTFNGKYESKWELDLESFLTRREISEMQSFLIKQRNHSNDNQKAWLEWFLIELGLNTGLRVFEMANLCCGDIYLRDELSFIVVRQGKGSKTRKVRINSNFQKSSKEFLDWKKRSGEDIGPGSYLIISPKSKTRYTTRGLQLIFKRCIKHVNIPGYHSIHHLRHTYASLLLRSSNNNLRLVQKQLGHSSLLTTQVYVDTFTSDIENAIEGILN